MGIGAGSQIPFPAGGGPTDTEKAYKQLRQAVGEGGSASNDTGIDGLWRHSRAKGLAVADSAERRAALQAIPHLATDAIPSYERLFGIVPPTGSTLAERAAVVAERAYEQPVAGTPDLLADLQKIDSRLSIIEIPYSMTGSTKFGRAFEAHDNDSEGPAFNLPSGRRHATAPNYSSHQVVRVRFTLGYSGKPNASDQLVIIRARERLRSALSSDVSFSISTGPWQLGITPIGLGDLWQT